MSIDYNLQYPIGKFADQPLADQLKYSEEVKVKLIRDIKFLPTLMESAVENLDAEQLHTAYRPAGWTIHQVVHHVADSHMNAYIRCKLALTEENPVIKPYDEAAWAMLSDTTNLPVNVSLTLLHALHARWAKLLANITEDEWDRTVYHPQHQQTYSLWYLLGTYSWHGKHHAGSHQLTARQDGLGQVKMANICKHSIIKSMSDLAGIHLSSEYINKHIYITEGETAANVKMA